MRLTAATGGVRSYLYGDMPVVPGEGMHLVAGLGQLRPSVR